MECPKCHKIIPDNATVCPHCRKVLSLTCPNCHSGSKNSVCEKCGYLILEKCAKCGKMVPTSTDKCKCGLEVTKSIACNECETDEFASLTVNFGSLKAIYDAIPQNEIGIAYKSLTNAIRGKNEYQNKRCTIKVGHLQQKQQTKS